MRKVIKWDGIWLWYWKPYSYIKYINILLYKLPSTFIIFFHNYETDTECKRNIFNQGFIHAAVLILNHSLMSRQKSTVLFVCFICQRSAYLEAIVMHHYRPFYIFFLYCSKLSCAQMSQLVCRLSVIKTIWKSALSLV